MTNDAATPAPVLPEVVTLCGSMRFFPLMLDVAAEETAAGRVVLSPFKTVRADAQEGELKTRLDELHRHKIALADRVIVVTDESGYTGTSTQGEMAYAAAVGKTVSVVARRALVPPHPPAANGRDQLVELLSAHLYDRGDYVPDWPPDERALHRNLDAWTDFADRAQKVRQLRYEKAAAAILGAGWHPPAQVITDPAALDALPLFSVVLADGVAHQAVPTIWGTSVRRWLKPAGQFTQTSADLLADTRSAGIAVLYVPAENGDADG